MQAFTLMKGNAMILTGPAVVQGVVGLFFLLLSLTQDSR
jgi:hypothetical protein